MPDKTFDVVVAGGGSKGLITAMYLAKYGGMSVGIFERLHEIGGAWCASEPAPGFIGDTCSTEIWPWYHKATELDFPDFFEKGAEIVYGEVSQAVAFQEDDSCLVFYHPSADTTRERTVESIARFSEKDADLYMKLSEIWSGGLRDAMIQMKYNPIPPPGMLSPFLELITDPKILEIIDPDIIAMSVMDAGKVAWESEEMVSYVLRRWSSGGIDPNEPGFGIVMYTFPLEFPEAGGTRGGSHNTAHAAHKILLEHGAKFFTGHEVNKVLLENGTAVGVKLADGSEIRARKLVLANMDPQQLCLKLIGRENLPSDIIKKIEGLESWRACGSWFQWALREPPEYKSAKWNPDVGDSTMLILSHRNHEHHLKEYEYRSKGRLIPEPVFMIYQHPYDKTRYPDGRWVGLSESPETFATALTEEEWKQYRTDHAEYVIDTWSKYAPNVNWDNVIDYQPQSPYDLAGRLTNMAPNGNWICIDPIPSQLGANRPIPEMADHRTPINNLYATGVAWGMDLAASSTQGYTCYKSIAEDLDLRKPWEEQGRSW